MILTENGLYEVLMQSKKPIVKTFKKGGNIKLTNSNVQDMNFRINK